MIATVILSMALASTTKATVSAPVQMAPVAACDTVTRSQVEAALGRVLKEESEKYSKLSCIRDFSVGDVEVRISIQHLTAPLNVAAELADLQKSVPEAKLWEVAGLNGRAFALEIPDAGTQLHVLSNDQEYMMVSVLGVTDDDHGYGAAMKIARALVDAR